MDVSPDILTKELAKLKEYQRTKINGRPSVVFKPEYIIRRLVAVNARLFDFESHRNAQKERQRPGSDVTPFYAKGASPLYATRSYLEYTYKRKFAILTCYPTEKPNEFLLRNNHHLNKYCRHPGTMEVVQPSEYWCEDIAKERPEFLCFDRPQKAPAPSTKKPLGTFDTERLICVVDGVEYVQDSCIIYNHNHTEIKRAHVVAGVTCGTDRFVYNGWTTSSADPALAGRRMANHIPCPLYPMDWTKVNDDFCIAKKTCAYPKALDPTDMCFNPKKGHVVYLLFRKDIYDAMLKASSPVAPPRRSQRPVVAPPPPRQCPPGHELNPSTGRCRKSCTSGQVRNPTTGRCVGSLPAPAPAPGLARCPPGHERNPSTGRCRKSCTSGQVRNPTTGRCIKQK